MDSQARKKTSKYDRLITMLEGLAGFGPGGAAGKDRQALAALRRSVSTWPSIPGEAIRLVAPCLPSRLKEEHEMICYLVAGLFSLHPCATVEGAFLSLGASLKRASQSENGGGAERRLLALLNSRLEDIPIHLRHVIAYLRGKDAPVDYRQLLLDLIWWEGPEQRVQRRWGRDFWAEPGGGDAGQLDDTQKKESENAA